MKTITLKFLQKLNACPYGIVFVNGYNLIGLKGDKFIDELMKLDHFDYANWLIVRLMSKKQKIQYSIFAAEQVIDIYEKKYPDDNCLCKAIEAAKTYLKHPSEKNKNVARIAANTAFVAANAIYFPYNINNVTINEACAAYAAANAAYSFNGNLAASAACNAVAIKKELQLKIIEYGKNLIK